MLAAELADLRLIQEYPEVFVGCRVAIWAERIPEARVLRGVYSVRTYEGRVTLELVDNTDDYAFRKRPSIAESALAKFTPMSKRSPLKPRRTKYERFKDWTTRNHGSPYNYIKLCKERKRQRLEAEERARAESSSSSGAS